MTYTMRITPTYPFIPRHVIFVYLSASYLLYSRNLHGVLDAVSIWCAYKVNLLDKVPGA